MHYLSIDHIVVYVFLLVTLVVGLWAGRAIKDIEEYAIANRVYGTGVLTITFLATFIGGSTIIGTTGNVFRDGILPIIATGVAPMICILWMAVWIAPRIIHFEGSLTMGDIMGTLYGRHGQVATGVLGFLFTICAVSAQIVALAYVYEFLLGFKSYWAIGLGGLIAVTYASMGGMKAVTTTDVLQFAVLVIVIPMIANVMTHEVGGIKELLSKVPAEKLQIAGHAKIGYYTSLALFLGVLSPFLLSPPFVAHMLMAREKKQATHMLFMGVAFLLFFFFLIMLIGLAAFVLYPSIAPDKIIPHVVIELFPVGLRGVCAAGIIAVIMSTADSCLHAAGLSLIHDVIRPLSTAKIQELRWVKYCTFAIGCASMLMTLVAHSIFGIVVYGMGMMGAAITVPFVAGVLGLKTDPKSFKIALWVTIPVFIATNLQFSAEIHHWAYPVSLIVNVLTFFGTHVLQNKGFMLEKRMSVGNQRLLWRPTWSGWTRWLPTPRKLLAYSHQKVSQYGTDSTLFALFLSLNYMVPFFMYSYSNPSIYGWILAIKSISIFLCLGLLLKPYWPPKLLAYFPAYYHLTLLYCLPFVTTFIFLLEERNIEWVVNVALSILFLIVLVDWTTFLGLSVLGVLLAIVLYKLGIDAVSIHMDLDTRYTLIYAITFSTLIGLLFARRKQLSFDKLATDNQALLATELVNKERLLESFREKVRIIQTLKHAGIQNLLQVAKLLKDLRAKEPSSPISVVTPHIESTLIPMALQLQALEHRATDYLRLQVETLSVSALLEKVQTQLLARGKQKGVHYQVHARHEELECDASRITTLLINSIAAVASPDQKESPIHVVLEETQLHYPLPSVQADYIKKVAALRLTVTTRAKVAPPQASYTAQMNGASLSAPESERALFILENKRIVKAHYGYSCADQDGYHYVIPVYLGEVRPIDMDKPYMELGVAPVRADDHYPGAQAQEQAFFTAVSQHTKGNLATVQTVLEIIKWYHGPMKRQTGEPFYLHPLAVAQIVLDYNQDEATILAALLHDTVEDTAMLLTHIEAIFGKETAAIVDKVTHLESSQDSFYKIKLSAEENILMLLESGDDRAMYVKLADRVHNLRTIESKSTISQVRIAKETLQFFVPQAQRLGLHEAAKELQEGSMRVLGKTIR
ncbi:MAG: hypothetical protein RL012_155 [Bacteroidota bacterium]